MKKILVFLFFACSSLFIQANIFIPPPARVSELYFDSQDNWYLEISYFDGQWEFETIDSIVIFTPTSRYKLNCQFDSTFNINYLVVSSIDVGDSLIINPQGDSIGVKTYWNSPDANYLEDEHRLIFGEYSGSIIQKPDSGNSICFFDNFQRIFIEHPEPSLGEQNKTGSAFAYLSGKMYDDNQLILRGWFGINFQFYSNQGNFLTPILPSDYSISKVAYFFDKDWHQRYTIQPIKIAANAGDTVYADIHITDSDFVGISSAEVPEKIKVFPNPTSNKINIRFENAELSQQACEVELYDVQGKKVLYQVFNPGATLELDVLTIRAGIYTIKIVQDKKLISTERIIVNPF